MSAETLRRAATEIRDEWSENRAMGQDRTEWRTWRAVADLLDEAANVTEYLGPGMPGSTNGLALAVARAYLGVTS